MGGMEPHPWPWQPIRPLVRAPRRFQETICGAALGLSLLALPSGAETYLVNPQGTGDFPTIQAAVDGAAPGDTIALADGVFTGEGNRDIDPAGKPLTIQSLSNDPQVCVLACDGSARGVCFITAEGPDTSIRGLTIREGFAPDGGGAVLCRGSSPTIENCVFDRDSTLSYGGAVFCDAGAAPTISGCTFLRCRAEATGGALDAYQSSPTITSCTFYANGAAIEGGALSCRSSSLSLTRSILAFSTEGEGLAVSGTGTWSIGCCNLYANAHGDWIGSLAPLRGQDGNISLPPLFCDPLGGDLRIGDASACAPEHSGGCGLIGAQEVGCAATVYRVNAQGTGDFPTIGAAVQVAPEGALIELEDGTYTGNGNRDIFLQGRRVILRSRSGDPHRCILDCEGSETAQHRGFYFQRGETRETVLEGITVRGGYYYSGAGIRCNFSSSPTIKNCRLVDCGSPHAGGGLHCTTSDPAVLGCALDNNWSDYGGGVISFFGARPTLTDCVISNNWALSRAGGASSSECAPTYIRCTFSGNSAPVAGGVFSTDDEVRFRDCLFVGNEASQGGGALYCRDALLCSVTGSTFSGNGAADGSGLYCENSTPGLMRTILAFGTQGAAVHCAGGQPILLCCDVYGNAGGDWVGCIAEQYGVEGNISADPLFCDDLNPLLPYLLQGASPCAAENNPSCGQIGAFPIGCAAPQDVPHGGLPSWREPHLSIAPNPMTATAALICRIYAGAGARQPVRVEIVDASGRLVRRLLNAELPGGCHRVTWDGCDRAGRPAPAGAYFGRLIAGGRETQRRLLVVR